MLHKLISPFVGLLFVLTMSACSVGSSDSGNDIALQGETKAVETLSVDEKFVKDMHQVLPSLDTEISDDMLIELADEVCTFLDAGYTAATAVKLSVEEGMVQKQAISMVELTVNTYCPQHTETMNRSLTHSFS